MPELYRRVLGLCNERKCKYKPTPQLPLSRQLYSDRKYLSSVLNLAILLATRESRVRSSD